MPGPGCAVDDSESANHRSEGTLDVLWYLGAGQTTGYYMFPLMKNNMMSTTGSGEGEQNCMTVREAKVNLKLGALGDGVETTKYKVLTAVTICPGETRAVQLQVIPPHIVESIASRVPENGMEHASVEIKMVAKRGRTTIESNTFVFPINICNGCLIKNLGDCNSPAIPNDPAMGNDCNPAQDNRLDCCTTGVDWICPAESTYEERPEG